MLQVQWDPQRVVQSTLSSERLSCELTPMVCEPFTVIALDSFLALLVANVRRIGLSS